jgi:beta-lactamase regulating signal transducer with metallopeptidase domain
MNGDLGTLMFTQLWQVTALAVFVWRAVRWLAWDRPHLAHALWLLVLIKCITPPVLASPTSPFSWLQSGRNAYQTTQNSTRASFDQSSAFDRSPSGNSLIIRTNLFGHEGSDRTSSQMGTVQVSKLDDLPAASQLPTGESLSSQSKRSSWLNGLAALWVCGAVLALIVAATRFLLFWRLTDHQRVIAEPWLEQAVSKWARELGLKRQVRLRVVDSRIGPAVVGLVRPSILLPVALVEGRNENDLRPLLTHELIHIRRGDLCWSLIQTLAGSWFWFHPLIRFGVRMVTRESERSCDEETVANLGCSPAAYARCLLDVLELKQSLRVAPAVPGIRPVDITSNRMERIMKLGHGCQKRTPFWVWLVMLVCGSAVLPGAALVLGQESGQPAAGSRLRPAPTSDHRLPIIKQDGEAGVIENGTDSLSVQVYEVADLLKKANEIISSKYMKLVSPGKLLLEALPQINRSSVVGHGLQDSQSNLKLFGNSLYVYGSEEDHKIVKDHLKHLREMGFKNIVVEVFFVTASGQAVMQEPGIEWSPTNAEADDAAVFAVETVGAITAMSEVDFDPSTLVDAQFKQVAYEVSLEENFDPQNFSGISPAHYYPDMDQICTIPTKQVDSSRRINALQRRHEVRYAIKRNNEVDSWMARLKTNKDTTLNQAPTVTLFSGGYGTIIDGAFRPFVIGLQRHEQGLKQPKIGVVCEGTFWTLNAQLQSNGSIQLFHKMVFSKVEDVSAVTLDRSWASEDENAPVIRLPIVSFLGLSSGVQLPEDHTLIINLSEARQNNKTPSPSLIFIRCRAIETKQFKPYQFGKLPAKNGGNVLTLEPGRLSPDLTMHAGLSARMYHPQIVGDVDKRLIRADQLVSSNSNLHLPLLSNIPYIHRQFTNDRVPRIPEYPEVVPVDSELAEPQHPATGASPPVSVPPYIQRLIKENQIVRERKGVNGENGSPDFYYLTQDLQFSGHPAQSSPTPEPSLREVVIRSQDKEKNDASKTIVEKLDGLGIELHLETEVERVQTNDGLLLRGQRVFFELKDFELACEQGELELKAEGNFRFSGHGVKIEHGLELLADRVEVTRNAPKQIIIELHGNSEVAFDGRKFKADKIKLFCADSKVYLEGDATISQTMEDGATKTTKAKKIIFDIIRETELVIEQ